jgi:hypothetical protein
MPVNVDNINKTIARIRQNQNFKFDMASWGDTDDVQEKDGHPCGTSACIAGFASLTSGSVPVVKDDYSYEVPIKDENGDVIDYEEKTIKIDILDFDKTSLNGFSGASDVGQHFLGIGSDQADSLFIPRRDSVSVLGESGHYETVNGPYWFSATDEQAIKVLEHLRDTGEVNWTKSGIVAEDSRFYEVYKTAHNGMTVEEVYDQNAKLEAKSAAKEAAKLIR